MLCFLCTHPFMPKLSPSSINFLSEGKVKTISYSVSFIFLEIVSGIILLCSSLDWVPSRPAVYLSSRDSCLLSVDFLHSSFFIGSSISCIPCIPLWFPPSLVKLILPHFPVRGFVGSKVFETWLVQKLLYSILTLKAGF